MGLKVVYEDLHLLVVVRGRVPREDGWEQVRDVLGDVRGIEDHGLGRLNGQVPTLLGGVGEPTTSVENCMGGCIDGFREMK